MIRLLGCGEQGINRAKMFSRHGGDLQGIMDHLDYLKELGVTAIWLTPAIENDEPAASYHGYARLLPIITRSIPVTVPTNFTKNL